MGETDSKKASLLEIMAAGAFTDMGVVPGIYSQVKPITWHNINQYFMASGQDTLYAGIYLGIAATLLVAVYIAGKK